MLEKRIHGGSLEKKKKRRLAAIDLIATIRKKFRAKIKILFMLIFQM